MYLIWSWSCPILHLFYVLFEQCHCDADLVHCLATEFRFSRLYPFRIHIVRLWIVPDTAPEFDSFLLIGEFGILRRLPV